MGMEILATFAGFEPRAQRSDFTALSTMLVVLVKGLDQIIQNLQRYGYTEGQLM